VTILDIFLDGNTKLTVSANMAWLALLLFTSRTMAWEATLAL
jgi:hypothetical protein